MSELFIPPAGAIQVGISIDWEDQRTSVPEYSIWVMPIAKLCPDRKRGFKVIDPKFVRSGRNLVCECYARVIE